jgi:hypothetical protein
VKLWSAKIIWPRTFCGARADRRKDFVGSDAAAPRIPLALFVVWAI